MLGKYGTEQVGISAEIALADLVDVKVDSSYRSRGRVELIDHIKPAIKESLHKFPRPITHTAGDQNPVDFELEGGKTLSVKSTMRGIGKISPQNIGQPTSTTFWSKLPHLVPSGIKINQLSYAESSKLFKEVAQNQIVPLLEEYWRNIFDCDYMLYVHDVLNEDDSLSTKTKVEIFNKSETPNWVQSKITFTKSVPDWNESCTVKYATYSIGEFQVHQNRNCFKFRFNVDGLIKSGLLS